ncbi:tyrosine-type recombinase/integrase [Acinetobacter sp. NIPH 298]|uniref:tyrosine-type recombinase/integrase n=1 Tax=Acinetobacter sp. NIPH 298 TaxID=1217692 RepID=UPI0002CFB940|nr:tyrosine-type recombinase/integrase [Acinetobacter sp. NIPH 298]ENW93785.1 hypothetical protein F903_03216 [Acinetobacter sp. NIPH 298]
MGTITQRKLKDGTIRYRAEIRINRNGFPPFKESQTFSTKRAATIWLGKREAEIEENPEILRGLESLLDLTLDDAISKYLAEVGDQYGRTKTYSLKLLQKLPIAQNMITEIGSSQISSHVALRKKGISKFNLQPIATSTLQHELLHIRGVLSHASIMWNLKVDLQTFDKTTAQLRKTRQISSSRKRDRLPTFDELERLTKYFVKKWNHSSSSYPMHLIMWFAVFSCRRESEITRMQLTDYDEVNKLWKIRDLKNPNGSKGNHKEFNVNDDCQQFIKFLLDEKIRNRMLKRGYCESLLVPLNAKAIGSEFRNACKLLEIEDLHFHDLRHEGCTRLAELGKTIPQIQQVSLHDSWSSLERYVSVKARKNVMPRSQILELMD